MYDEKQHDYRHRPKMDKSSRVEIAKERGQDADLHRLPNRNAGQDDQDARSDDAAVKEALDGVVDRQIRMSEASGERRANVADYVR
jgi:hypothetical protein